MAEIQKSMENEWVEARETPRKVAPRRWEARRIATFDALSKDLAGSLRCRPVADFEAASLACLEVVATGLSADRVSLLAATECSEVFETARTWERASIESVGILPKLDLGVWSELAEALRSGNAFRDRALAFPECSFDFDTRFRVGQPESPSGTRIFLPCLGPEGLLAVLVVDRAPAAADGPPGLIQKAMLVAEALADFLERRRLSLALDAARERRAQSGGLEDLGRIASSVAHDFNNMLTAILGYADLLELDLPEGASGHTELREIEAAALRATHLVDQVLCFGKPQSPCVRAIEVAPTLEELSGMLQRVVGSKIEVALHVADDLEPIRVDPGAFERILLNLASNARDAIESTHHGRGHFWISAEAVRLAADSGAVVPSSSGAGDLTPGRYLRIEVRDDGCGICPDAREKLFDAFFSTKGPSGGTGLGLSSVAERICEVGGAIRLAEHATADSDNESGSAFHLYFPIG